MIQSSNELLIRKRELKGHKINWSYFKSICNYINQKRGYSVKETSDEEPGASFFHCQFSRARDSSRYYLLCRPPLAACCKISRKQYDHYFNEGFEGMERGKKDFINEAVFYNDRGLKNLLSPHLLILDAHFLRQKVNAEDLNLFKKLRMTPSFDEVVSFWQPRQISELIFNWWED